MYLLEQCKGSKYQTSFKKTSLDHKHCCEIDCKCKARGQVWGFQKVIL